VGSSKHLGRALLAAFLLIVAGCSVARYENTPLADGQSNPERRLIAPADPDRPALMMTFSGGGSRAATLAESVLRDLQSTTYLARDGRRSLIQDIRLVSSVSGGSVTAGWLGLHPEGDLDTLRRDFLARDNMAALYLDSANPITWVKLAFTGSTRSDVVEDLFDDRLFHGAKLAELNRPDRPLILLNTTDMAGGETFIIAPQRLDDICSSFDELKLSTAVAASAAVPVVLSPINLRNYATGCPGKLRSDGWARNDLASPEAPYLDLRRYRSARYTNDLRRGPDQFRNIEYVHLLDGGLADNLGVTALRSALTGFYDPSGGLRAINEGRIRRLVVIMVNARADPPNHLYQYPGKPGTTDMINAVTTVPMESNTSNAQQAMTNLLVELAKVASAARAANADFAGMKVYGIAIDYDQFPADTPEHRALRDEAKAVPTSWTLTPRQLVVTEQAGAFLLRRHPCYRELLSDLHAASPASGDSLEIPCLTKIVE
jgi:NTE family protein